MDGLTLFSFFCQWKSVSFGLKTFNVFASPAEFNLLNR